MPDPSERESRYRAMYETHYSAISAFAVRRLGSTGDVADAVAEVFTIAWRRFEVIPGPPEDRLWLYGVARRVVAGHYRSSTRRRKLLTRLTSQRGPAPHTANDGIHEQLLVAIEDLRSSDREALLLVAWDGLTNAQAAQVLGCSVNALAIRVHRAKTRVRAVLADRPSVTDLADPTPLTPKITRD
jgi:RNA polymerase sigma factor (sigma-70 family)